MIGIPATVADLSIVDPANCPGIDCDSGSCGDGDVAIVSAIGTLTAVPDLGKVAIVAIGIGVGSTEHLNVSCHVHDDVAAVISEGAVTAVTEQGTAVTVVSSGACRGKATLKNEVSARSGCDLDFALVSSERSDSVGPDGAVGLLGFVTAVTDLGRGTGTSAASHHDVSGSIDDDVAFVIGIRFPPAVTDLGVAFIGIAANNPESITADGFSPVDIESDIAEPFPGSGARIAAAGSATAVTDLSVGLCCRIQNRRSGRSSNHFHITTGGDGDVVVLSFGHDTVHLAVSTVTDLGISLGTGSCINHQVPGNIDVNISTDRTIGVVISAMANLDMGIASRSAIHVDVHDLGNVDISALWIIRRTSPMANLRVGVCVTTIHGDISTICECVCASQRDGCNLATVRIVATIPDLSICGDSYAAVHVDVAETGDGNIAIRLRHDAEMTITNLGKSTESGASVHGEITDFTE